MTLDNPEAIRIEEQSGALRLVVFGGWGLGLMPPAAALLAGNALWPIAAGVLVFAIMGAAALRLPGDTARPVAAIALVGQGGVLTAALAGHAWQVDSHMAFFAMLAVLMILRDRRAVLVAAAAIVLHHLVLTLFLPALVYPPDTMILNLERLAIHGVVVLVETAALVYALLIRERLHRSTMEDRDRLARESEQAREARSDAETALETARQARADAEQAQARAEAAARQAEEEKERAAQAAAERRAAEERDAARQAEAAARQARVVDDLRRGLKRLADHDLQTRIETAFPEEYEELRRDFNAALAALQTAMESVLEGADTISTQTTEITSAADDLSRRTENQAATLAEVSASVSSLTGTVKETAGNAGQANQEVGRTRSEAKESEALVGKAVLAMGEIETSSQQIQSIIKVIDDIAFQTNLLALNAGVEAARAGDAGRGFAVVASEVRALAQRSSEAALEIKTLIETSGNHVRDGVDLVNKTGEALRAVSESVEEISRRVAGIAASAEQQSASLTEIDTALGELDRVTQSNAAMFEQTTAASRTLRAGTEGLVETIAVFIPRAGAAAGRPGDPGVAARPASAA